MKLTDTNKVICSAPFTALYVRRDALSGNVGYSCCCNLPTQDSIDKLIEVQDNIKKGLPSAICDLCYQHELKGGYSERIRTLDLLGQEQLDKFVHTYTLDHYHLLMQLSSRCPLACRSCSPRESSTYAGLFKHDVHPSNIIEINEDPAVDLQIKKLLNNLYKNYNYPTIHFTGGEVLVHKNAGGIIQWLIDRDYANRFELMFTTSLSVTLPEWLLDSLSKFRAVRIDYSIDSTNENYNYVRWPGKFEKVVSNLKKLNQISSTCNQFESTITTVFSINNIMYSTELLDFVSEQNILLTPIHLHTPAHLALEILPDPYRKTIQEKIKDNLSHSIFQNDQPILKEYFQKMYKLLAKSDLQNEKQFLKYLEFTAEFDKKTNTKLSEQNSRFWDLLTTEHKNYYENFI